MEAFAVLQNGLARVSLPQPEAFRSQTQMTHRQGVFRGALWTSLRGAKRAHHLVHVSRSAIDNVKWWSTMLPLQNGKLSIMEDPECAQRAPPCMRPISLW